MQLILFFDVYNMAKSSNHYNSDFETSSNQCEMHHDEVKATEREVQTDLHPIPYNKDETYVWNLWDYRRKAIELVTF